jgi:hypothetical protein|tara:strand:- start:267 stop:392 length:126 start_codon:yes stop_codon:yes gene_type:complete
MPNVIKNIPNKILKNKLKTGVIFGLSAYWGVILIGTFISFE